MENQDLEKTAGLLAKNWGLERPDTLDLESLRLALQVQLGFMLSGDFERLVQTMYRLDVSESKFQAALLLTTVDERAMQLANIVLDRELLRLQSWRKYSQG